MAMGDEFNPNDIHAYQLADFAETCGIDKKLFSRLLTDLANKVIKQLSTGALMDSLNTQSHFSADEINYFKQLGDNILTKTEYLKAQAAEVPSIDV